MSVQTHRWVAGVVNVNQINKNEPYTFFEIDTPDEQVKQKILAVYRKWNIDVIEHRIGKGYHFFGNAIDRSIWRDWYAELKPLNPKYPPLTLRITRKYIGEAFERPVYHEAQNIVPNWSKAIMHFLNKEMRGLNDTNLKKSTHDCGLHKYFTVVVYDWTTNEPKNAKDALRASRQ